MGVPKLPKCRVLVLRVLRPYRTLPEDLGTVFTEKTPPVRPQDPTEHTLLNLRRKKNDVYTSIGHSYQPGQLGDMTYRKHYGAVFFLICDLQDLPQR